MLLLLLQLNLKIKCSKQTKWDWGHVVNKSLFKELKMDLLSDTHGSQHCEHQDGEGEETAEGVYDGVDIWKATNK